MQHKEKILRKRRLQNKEKREKFEEKKSILQGKKHFRDTLIHIIIASKLF